MDVDQSLPVHKQIHSASNLLLKIQACIKDEEIGTICSLKDLQTFIDHHSEEFEFLTVTPLLFEMYLESQTLDTYSPAANVFKPVEFCELHALPTLEHIFKTLNIAFQRCKYYYCPGKDNCVGTLLVARVNFLLIDSFY